MSQNEMNKEFQLKKHDILCNKSVQYRVLDFIGEGCFGKVAKCINLNTSETVAIKINKELIDHVAEVKMLEQLRTLDPEVNNLVRFEDSFIFKGMSCIAFQMLDRSLWDLMYERPAVLTLNEIRPIARQLLVAFKALKGIDLLHTDLKPDNVMLVNHQDDPFRVKLIDFGLAIPASEVREGMIMQPCAYRAPEVTLGLPISEAIDMWALGCLLAELFFGRGLFTDNSTYNAMKTACHLLGQPEDHLLNAGKYTNQYFKRDYCSPNSRWRLKTSKEYKDATGIQTISNWIFDTVGTLDEVVEYNSNANTCVEHEDIMAFLNLLKRLLDPNAATRITPSEALDHCFVTMAHLVDHIETYSYPNAAYDLMTVSPPFDSEECDESTDSRDGFSDTDSSRYETADSIAYNGDPPTPQQPIQIQKNDILCNKSVQYRVLDLIGEGGFGKVAKCVNLKTKEITAIKIHKDLIDHITEVKMLKQLRTLDPEENNLAHMEDHKDTYSYPNAAYDLMVDGSIQL
ncbi:homeodomain-interacting protein kinase 3-like [Anarrhichthys ocellatus]|uniref:homeodomain-interacting protein kinase 3-like n=1 Tax=Anarrhichthys ocellatus TaxID=433405 RepID=UPI0012ED75EC|nr:homeodomain-interacting protein kinase 3-like [Anarrhichthys ocellatus]